MFKTLRILLYFFLTIILLILSFTPIGYAFYYIIQENDVLIYMFSPLIIFLSYSLTVVIFAIIHSQFVIRFTLGSGPIKPGKYPHNTGEGRLIGVRLTADSIFKSMIKVYTFIPFIWGMFIFPYGMRLYGLKTGKNVHIATNTYIESAGLVEIGDHSFVGYGAAISAHAHENREIVVSPIKIGRRVTIGGKSGVAPGVEIGDNSIIGAYSIVTKGVKVPTNEIWIGMPAKFLKKKDEKRNIKILSDSDSESSQK